MARFAADWFNDALTHGPLIILLDGGCFLVALTTSEAKDLNEAILAAVERADAALNPREKRQREGEAG